MNWLSLFVFLRNIYLHLHETNGKKVVIQNSSSSYCWREVMAIDALAYYSICVGYDG